MEKTCTLCGDTIVLTKEQKQLLEDGEISNQQLPDHCTECNEDIQGPYDYSYESHSDADIGL